MDTARLISKRAGAVDASGIRRIFELGASLSDPINLSIGQPHFPVPDAVKRAAIEAIENNRNGYTLTQGVPELRERIGREVRETLGWDSGEVGTLVTSGTSGALLLAAMTLLEAGDEFVIPDPYFVMYPQLGTLTGARPVLCDTYPDFKLTAARVEPLLNERTKFVLACTPSNPAGVTLSAEEGRELRELCAARGVLLISDEIYDRFVFPTEVGDSGPARFESPAEAQGAHEHTLVIRGFGKTYGCTGWRLGYAAGPRDVVDAMTRIQQYTFVCAPSMAQWGALAALDTDISDLVADYARKRDEVVARLSAVTELATPTGAFYAFPKIPERLGLTGSAFAERAVKEKSLLVIPGGVFSSRDTHVRVSFAASDETLGRGLDALASLMAG